MKILALISLILACSCNAKSDAAPPKPSSGDDCTTTKKFAAMIPEDLIGKCECFDGTNESCKGSHGTQIIWIEKKPGELPDVKVGLDWTPKAPPAPAPQPEKPAPKK